MEGSDNSSVHVLLLSYPILGHINPLLQLGKRLAAHRGVRCTLAVTRFVLGQEQAADRRSPRRHLLRRLRQGRLRRGRRRGGVPRAAPWTCRWRRVRRCRSCPACQRGSGRRTS
ncbi:hypothetical protein PAHAL_2G333200 [Panicum hallii]|uniref:Uncharacterized protein n=1 Tax=Panicum hallii TaxID=206008 RepID=A0A2S3H0B7_9POAL|nr:hypothetical protein PAHAL_2G333200 [Panicum hallii]